MLKDCLKLFIIVFLCAMWILLLICAIFWCALEGSMYFDLGRWVSVPLAMVSGATLISSIFAGGGYIAGLLEEEFKE